MPVDESRKAVEFVGSSLRDLKSFPTEARSEVGYQINLVQRGLEPANWKPMPSIGSGACEIRVRDEAGAFRVIYVAKMADAVFVLHCFQKKTQKTSTADITLAKQRYVEMTK